MKTNRCFSLSQFMYDAGDGVLIEFFFVVVTENRREHCTSPHKKVDEPTDEVVVKKVGSYGKENASRQCGAIKVDPCDDEEIKKSSMV